MPCMEPGIHHLRNDPNTSGTVKLRDDSGNNHLVCLYLQGKDFAFGCFLSLTPLLSVPFAPTTSALSKKSPRLGWGRGRHPSASVLFCHLVTGGMSSGVTGNQIGKTTVPVFALLLPGLLSLLFLTQQQPELSS